jgi:mRNA-degrading endonuclease RelE of RelBE toxin-antitoxin system
MRRYRPLYSDNAAEVILGLSKRKQRKVIDTCNELAANFFIKPDYVVRDSDGREIEHIRIGEFLIAYWVDHPVCKVMIVDLEYLG